MMSLVFFEAAFSKAAMSKPKSLSSRSGMGTGTPPTKLMTDS